jgi:hypothetical protein
MGYRRFALSPQMSVKYQVAPKPALEGRYADHTFRTHSSGLFGRELPEPWRNDAGAAFALRFLTLQFKVYGILRRLGLHSLRRRMAVAGQWYDIHATA